MTKRKRKTPIKHVVRQHVRAGRDVRMYVRGKGSKSNLLTKKRLLRIRQYNQKEWDRDFGKFSEKYDEVIEDTFSDNTRWLGIIESIGRPGAKDLPIDHKEELLFYIRSKETPKEVKEIAKKLYKKWKKFM